MLLTLDQGNSCLKLGAFSGAKLQGVRRANLDATLPLGESANRLQTLALDIGVQPQDVDRIVLSCVVPALTSYLVAACGQAFDRTPLLVNSSLRTGLRLAYDRPETLGADRIGNAVAARARCSGCVICVDLGTAINLDVVTAEGVFAGGVIAPGMQLSFDALTKGTAQLPNVPLSLPSRVVATTTVQALQSGAVFGFAGLVAGLVEAIETELAVHCTVVATGGHAALIQPVTPRIDELVPHLTMEGLRLLHKLNPG